MPSIINFMDHGDDHECVGFHRRPKHASQANDWPPQPLLVLQLLRAISRHSTESVLQFVTRATIFTDEGVDGMNTDFIIFRKGSRNRMKLTSRNDVTLQMRYPLLPRTVCTIINVTTAFCNRHRTLIPDSTVAPQLPIRMGVLWRGRLPTNIL